MFEKALLRFLRGAFMQCEKHYPCCDQCPFGNSNMDCDIRQFIQDIQGIPKDWNMEKIEAVLKWAMKN